MKTLWRVYQVLLVANFQQASQYRVQSVLWLLFAVVRPVVFLAAWSAAAAAQGGSIGDYSIADFAAYYVCLTLVTQLTMAWNAYDRVVFVFAGQIAPLSLLPGPLAVVGYALPFAYMLWAPAEILRGGMPFGQAMLVVAAQVVWLLLSWIAFVVVWRLGLRQFSAVGA